MIRPDCCNRKLEFSAALERSALILWAFLAAPWAREEIDVLRLWLPAQRGRLRRALPVACPIPPLSLGIPIGELWTASDSRSYNKWNVRKPARVQVISKEDQLRSGSRSSCQCIAFMSIVSCPSTFLFVLGLATKEQQPAEIQRLN